NDWSSTLPVHRMSYFYPSVNGSFILSQALHLTSNQLNFVKLSGGWSEVGAAASAYQLINTYNFSPTLFGANPRLSANSVDLNPDLKPEQTTSTELGLDAGFFNNRVSLDVSLYNMNSFNQILAVDVSSSTGYQQKLINGGEINNKGLEIELGLTPIQSPKFNWNMMINYSTNHSNVVNLDPQGNLQSYILGSDGTIQVLAAVGQPYGALFGTAFERNAQGEIIVDQNGLPVTDPNNKYLGHYTPDWMGSINNNFSFHHFQLSFLIDAHFGGSIYSSTNSTGTYTGVLASTLPGRDEAHGGLLYYYPGNDNSQQAIPLPKGASGAPGGATIYDDGMIFKGIQQSGKPNDVIIPAQDYYKALSTVNEAFVYNASYIKLREVRIGYELPGRFIHFLRLQGADISLIGRNLWIISKHVPNIDPETAFNTGNDQGLEDLSLPSVRTVAFNINLKF
ncbi:MAG: TonB-dependent receptor domain-containing protein, partial [Chitinophagaceae bacterium]